MEVGDAVADAPPLGLRARGRQVRARGVHIDRGRRPRGQQLKVEHPDARADIDHGGALHAL
jgi:hypothetical protein